MCRPLWYTLLLVGFWAPFSCHSAPIQPKEDIHFCCFPQVTEQHGMAACRESYQGSLKRPLGTPSCQIRPMPESCVHLPCLATGTEDTRMTRTDFRVFLRSSWAQKLQIIQPFPGPQKYAKKIAVWAQTALGCYFMYFLGGLGSALARRSFDLSWGFAQIKGPLKDPK